MSSHTHEAQHLLLLGMTGSGKTTAGIKFMLNAEEGACRFVFDWNERLVPRLPIRPCYTEADCEAALPSRWVILHPRKMFPGVMLDRKVGREALRWFAQWVRAVSKRGPGRKLFACAELWNFCTEDSIPPELAMLADDGRQDQVSFIFDTQHPQKLNASITGAATEIIAFKLIAPDALRECARLGLDAKAIKELSPGSFIAYNRISGATLRSDNWEWA
ncbi:MAG TPA: hypothetical protein PKA41_18090 [Verrucomicrobiota bacterium]|nr:hypothetical protein [Verrucomicrobiota bacterium]